MRCIDLIKEAMEPCSDSGYFPVTETVIPGKGGIKSGCEVGSKMCLLAHNVDINPCLSHPHKLG